MVEYRDYGGRQDDYRRCNHMELNGRPVPDSRLLEMAKEAGEGGIIPDTLSAQIGYAIGIERRKIKENNRSRHSSAEEDGLQGNS